MNNLITLNNLKLGNKCIIKRIDNEGSIRRRLLDIGLIPGTIITSILESPFKDPVAYEIRNAIIAIRREDSKKILVEEIH